MEENSAKVIVVLGMHRSGTSVITRGLQVLGVELGDHLMPPFEKNNPRGFWEDVDINTLNIEMLHFLKSDWHFLTPIQPSDVDMLCTNGYLQRAVELLREKTAGENIFGFKDPRVAKLLPFWKRVFAHGQWNVSYVLVIRHPLSVCESLAKRDGLDFEKSYLLWLEHVIGSLVGTEAEKRVLVDYDYFMQTPEPELTRLAKELGLPMNVAELQSFQLEFLDPKLQHTIYELDDLMLDEKSPPLLQEVYPSLLDVARGNSSLEKSALKNKIARWGDEFSRMKTAFIFADQLGKKLTTTIAERNWLNAERNALLVERNGLLHEKAQITQALMEKEEAAQKLKAELLAIYQSRFWRWTEPLRRLFSLLKRPK